MGSDIISHIIAIGLFYHKINIACKKMSFIHFRFSDILFSLYVRYFKFIKAGLTMFRSNFTAMSFCLIIIYTLIIAGDVELNPGPGGNTGWCIALNSPLILIKSFIFDGKFKMFLFK
jgi:hypothetical protein